MATAKPSTEKTVPPISDERPQQQAMLDSLPFDVWFKDLEGKYLAVNQSFAKYVGKPIECILGKKDRDLFPEDEAAIYIASDKSTLDNNEKKYYESIVSGKWKEEFKSIAFDKEGKPVGTTGFSRDISHRKELERALEEAERSKSLLLSHLPGVAFRCRNDKDWTMTFLSDGCLELTGYKPEELLNNSAISYNELISPEFRKSLSDKWGADIVAKEKSDDEYIIITKDGTKKWVWEQSIPVADEFGNLTESEGFIVDITDYKKALQELDESEDKFRTVFEKAPLGIGIFDTQTGTALELNQKFEEILDRKAKEIKTTDWRAYTHPADVQENIEKLKLIRQKKIDKFNLNKRFVRPSGEIIWVNMIVTPFKAETISDLHLCMIEDITDRKQKEDEIVYLSFHDSLTGLYNRTFFEEQKQQFDHTRQLPVSLIMGDLNNLKIINDAFGHDQGDLMIQEAGRLMAETCRQEDFIARIGGDEFVILMPATDAKGAAILCQRIEEVMNRYQLDSDRKAMIMSMALGFATKTEPGEQMDYLLKVAERMLYTKKNREKAGAQENIINAAIEKILEHKRLNAKIHGSCLGLLDSLADEFGLTGEQKDKLRLFYEVHDIGILSSLHSELKREEGMAEKPMDLHAESGNQIAMAIPKLHGIALEIFSHHERWDGTGTPGKLKGNEIPIFCRISSAVEFLEVALNQKLLVDEQVMRSIKDSLLFQSGKMLDPAVIEALLDTEKKERKIWDNLYQRF